MGLSNLYSLDCDGDNCKESLDDGQAMDSQAEILDRAREQGWTEDEDNDRWFCPLCSRIRALEKILHTYGEKMSKTEKNIIKKTITELQQKRAEESDNY